MTENFSRTATYIWNLAELLRGDFKQSQFGRVILPFTILRRLECVLEKTKSLVLRQADKQQSLTQDAQVELLLKVAGQPFFNTSQTNLLLLGHSLDSQDLQGELLRYVDAFSRNAREIFTHFRFEKVVGELAQSSLLRKVVQRVAATDLHPETLSNHQMGLIFEELIRRFAENSNETAGEHFTPKDIVQLTTSLVFMGDDKALRGEGITRTIYDPTAGTGGFLSSGMEYLHERNTKIEIRVYGQELNAESYAICKGDMLIKGQDVDCINLGNTLSDDKLRAERFDYMLSNPPFGVNWKKIEEPIKAEHRDQHFAGRFGPGLPRVSDGSLLFLLHLLSKMRDYDPNDANKNGGRIGIILNGSPLFTGGAGSGESEIRRHILQNDLLEAIVALPTGMFYNTGISTYLWVLSNRKPIEHRGRVQLIHGVHLAQKMKKGLGSKRQWLGEDDIALISSTFKNFETVETYSLTTPAEESPLRAGQPRKREDNRVFGAKIFEGHEFGYRRITVERPLRLSVQLSDERIERLSPQTGSIRKNLGAKAKRLQAELGSARSDDFNAFNSSFKQALKTTYLKLDAQEKKQLLDAISWKNPEAEPVIHRVLKAPSDPTYGAFEYHEQIVSFKPDTDLRDHEDVPLTVETAQGANVNAVNEEYFEREVWPHGKDAWINASQCDGADKAIGIVGYEIPFNRHFYQCEAPRSLMAIDKELKILSNEIVTLLQEKQP